MKTSTIRPERFYLLHEKMLKGNIVRSDSDRIHYQEMLAADSMNDQLFNVGYKNNFEVVITIHSFEMLLNLVKTFSINFTCFKFVFDTFHLINHWNSVGQI